MVERSRDGFALSMAIHDCISRIRHERQEKDFRLTFMGLHSSWYVIWMMFSLSLSSFAQGSNEYDIESLNAFIHDLANNTLVKHRTGTLYNLSLPTNFSGMEASVVRLRSGRFWAKGADFSFFHIPPRIRQVPSVKRLAILYQNLGNWSSYYYKVPGYMLVAPVVGFMAYDSSNSSTIGNGKVEFSISGDPILVHFSAIVLEGRNATPKCVKFGADGSFQFQKMNESFVCITKGQGHFSVVVQNKQGRQMKFPALGVGLGVVGLILVVLVIGAAFRLVRRKKMKKMEKHSERGVAFDSFWVGGSKMPRASMIRTQPALEKRYTP